MSRDILAGFIVIDDDPINNNICKKYVEFSFGDMPVKTFTHPRVAVEHIRSAYTLPAEKQTVILLDINMPVLTGWEVMEELSDLPDEVKAQFIIYILSSSIAAEDKERAAANPQIKGFIEKPLKPVQFQKLFAEFLFQ